MSYICEFCGVKPENCICPVDLTEPRLETELAVADNMMAVENQKPYDLINAPSAFEFFSLLVELEKQENDDELGPQPKWTRYPDEPTTPTKSSEVFPPIPKLERQTNMPEGLKLPDEDLNDLNVELFPEYIHYSKSPEYKELSRKLGNASCYEDFCSTILEMKDFYDYTSHCDCGTLYDVRYEKHGMCHKCDMAERRQDSIDQERYPDDIRERYDSH